MRKILIIGNGFDIYHGLPTKYKDFLFLVKHWDKFYDKYKVSTLKANNENKEIDIKLNNSSLCLESFDDYIKNKEVFNEDHIEYLNEHFSNNSWITYFLTYCLYDKTWIDFEKEIEYVLWAVNYFFKELPSRVEMTHNPSLNFDTKIWNTVRSFIYLAVDKYPNQYVGVVHKSDVELSKLESHRLYLVSKMKEELDILNNCLRFYLLEFVEPIKCNSFSNQINSLGNVYLLNFNYTNTYEKMYKDTELTQHHIHGNCKDGDMVLGISDESFSSTLDYVYFQKYFQRIQKRTGNYYKKWVEKDIRTSLYNEQIEVYIFGHSLDKTDKGILKDFLCGKNISKITIYYHSQSSYESMVINLIDMFGKDWVIDKTGNNKIIFVQLQPAKKV